MILCNETMPCHKIDDSFLGCPWMFNNVESVPWGLYPSNLLTNAAVISQSYRTR